MGCGWCWKGVGSAGVAAGTGAGTGAEIGMFVPRAVGIRNRLLAAGHKSVQEGWLFL